MGVDLVGGHLPAALKQFEYQATNRLLLAVRICKIDLKECHESPPQFC